MPSEEEIARVNEEYFKRTQADFNEFKSDFDQGICSICKKPFSTFALSRPCLHWLLVPEGFKKQLFPLIYNDFNFTRIRGFVRWIANCHTPMVNINDLREEKTTKKLIEETIKYNNLEWSLSCGQTDFEGHKDSEHGKVPHYHFQMRIDSLPFIDYGDFHPPLTLSDIEAINIESNKYPNHFYTNGPGAGIQEFMDRMSPEELLESMETADESKAPFRNISSIAADPGHTISGNDIVNIIEESQRTGIPLAILARKLKNVNISTTISPSDNIPALAPRKKRNKNS